MAGEIPLIFISGGLAAVFLPLGIFSLVRYYRLTHGLTVTATIVEHIFSTGRSKGRIHYSWLLKMKYYVNGVEYVNIYNVCETGAYVEAHPVGTEIEILVNKHNPDSFILPEDKGLWIIMGGMFTAGGIITLITMIKYWVNLK